MKTYQQIFSIAISGIVIVYMIINVLLSLKTPARKLKLLSGKTVSGIRYVISSFSKENFLKTFPLQILLALEAMLWIPLLISAFYIDNVGITIIFLALLNSTLLSALIFVNQHGLFASVSAGHIIVLINRIQSKLSSLSIHGKK